MNLLTQLLICILSFLLLVNSPNPTAATVIQSPVRQEALSLSQIERLINNRTPDNVIALQIRKRGIGFQLEQETLNGLKHMGAGPKTMQLLKAAIRKKPETKLMNNEARPKLWITYAWDNAKGGDFDFLVKELRAAGVNVTFDKIALVPGQRLWQQIAERIEDPELSGWAILITKESLQSEACKEELAYALDRTLSTKGGNFPLLGLIHQAQVKDMPLALRTRLLISLLDPQWPNLVVSGLKKQPPQQTANLQTRYIWEIVPNFQGQQGKIAIWVRPRFGEIEHWRFIFPSDAKFVGTKAGSPQAGLGGVHTLTMNYRTTIEMDQITHEVVVDGSGDRVTPGSGCFIVFTEPFPKFVGFAAAKGWNPDKPDEIDQSTFEVIRLSK